MSMRQYVEIRGAVPRPAMIRLFLRVMGQAKLSERVALYCVFFVTLGAFFNFVIFTIEKNPTEYFAAIIVAFGVLIWLLATYLQMKEAVFSRTYQGLNFEIDHFSTERDFFYYLLFLERVQLKGLFNRDALESCLRYLEIELRNNRPSNFGSDPLFLFLVAVWAGLIAAFFDSGSPKAIALLFLILFVITLVSLQIAGARRSSRKFLSRLEKYCLWALEIPEDEMKGMMRENLVRSRRLSRRQKPFMWPFSGHGEGK